MTEDSDSLILHFAPIKLELYSINTFCTGVSGSPVSLAQLLPESGRNKIDQGAGKCHDL